jgi:uncharacterized protein YcnI
MRTLTCAAVAASILFSTAIVNAHIEVASGSAIANTSQKITFAVAHGCTDTAGAKLDTISVKIDIPAGVTSVRAMTSDFGKPAATVDGSNNVTSLTWTKPSGDLQTGAPSDFQWYEITLRARIPNTPFTKIQFVVTQTCQDGVGAQTVVVWDQPEGSMTGSPSPLLKVVPPHRTGWNKVMMTTMIADTDLPTYFGDAQIVWRGNAAYSPSADVTALIGMTPGVSVLSGLIMPGDELWVKY